MITLENVMDEADRKYSLDLIILVIKNIIKPTTTRTKYPIIR